MALMNIPTKYTHAQYINALQELCQHLQLEHYPLSLNQSGEKYCIQTRFVQFNTLLIR